MKPLPVKDGSLGILYRSKIDVLELHPYLEMILDPSTAIHYQYDDIGNMNSLKNLLYLPILILAFGCYNNTENHSSVVSQGITRPKCKVYRGFDMFSFKPEKELKGDVGYPFVIPIYGSSGKLDSLNVQFDKENTFTSSFHYLKGVPYLIDTDYESTLRTFFVPPHVYYVEYVIKYVDGKEKPIIYVRNVSRMSEVKKDSVVTVRKSFSKETLLIPNEEEANHLLYFRNEKHVVGTDYMVLKDNKYIYKLSGLDFTFCHERGSLEFFWCYNFSHTLKDCKGHDNHHGDL